MMVFVVFLNVEIYRAVRLIGVAGIEDLLHELFLLDDVSRGVRLDAGRQHVEFLHRVVETIGIVLRHLHRFELFEACLFGNLVFAFVGIMLEVSHVGNVAHVAHLIAQMFQIAEHEVESHGGACVSEVRVAIHRGSANVHAYVPGLQGHEFLLGARERIVDEQVVIVHCI